MSDMFSLTESLKLLLVFQCYTIGLHQGYLTPPLWTRLIELSNCCFGIYWRLSLAHNNWNIYFFQRIMHRDSRVSIYCLVLFYVSYRIVLWRFCKFIYHIVLSTGSTKCSYLVQSCFLKKVFIADVWCKGGGGLK